MRTFMMRRPVLAHFLLSMLIASLVMVWSIARAIIDPASAAALATMVTNIYAGAWYVNMATIAVESARDPSLLAIFVFAAAPTIAALLLAGLGGGGGLAALLARLNPFGPERSRGDAIKLYVALLIIYAIGFLAYDFVAGPGVDAGRRLSGAGLGLAAGALLGLFIDEGGTLEEIGWRGFAFPLLQNAMRSPLVAAFLLGVLHWAWHLPREAPTLMSGAPLAAWATGQAVFLYLCIMLSIVACYAVNRAGGSVWPAIFVHGGSNVWAKGMGDHVGATFDLIDLRTLLLTVIAVAILVFAGRNLGRATAGAQSAPAGRAATGAVAA